MPGHAGRLGATLAGVLALALIAAAPASADTVTIGFDDLASGAMVTGQYAGQGVVFGVSPECGSCGVPEAFAPPPSEPAHSPPNVAGERCGVEVCGRSDVWAHLTTSASQVSLDAGTDIAGETLSLRAFDVDGKLLDQISAEPPAHAGAATPLAVSAPGAQIAFVDLHSSVGLTEGEAYYLDDLRLQTPAIPTPDFGIAASSTDIGLTAGASSQVTLTLHRQSGSTGRIEFSASGLPSGTHASFAPDPTVGGDGSTVAMTVSADAGAPAAASTPVTVTATPLDASAGSHPHSVAIGVAIQATYGIWTKAIVVTQGIQIPHIGIEPPCCGDRTVAYDGATLVAGKPTMARVIAGAPGAPLGGVANLTARLYGYYADGSPLPGSPLAPVASPDRLFDRSSETDLTTERSNARATYDFRLPPGWVGARTLKAEVLPAVLFGQSPSTPVPCGSAACLSERTLTLTGLNYVETGVVGIQAIAMDVKGQPAPRPYTAFAWADRVFPLRGVVPEVVGKMDISWIWAGCPSPSLIGFPRGTLLCGTRDDKNGAALSALESYNDDHVQEDEALFGITSVDLGVENGGDLFSGDYPYAVASWQRPLTSVGHELGHALGLGHAGHDCGAPGPIDDWPPDQVGLLEGIGLDMATNPPTPLPSSHHRNARWYDFMSYCADSANGDPSGLNAWISLPNWNRLAKAAARQWSAAAGASQARIASASAGAAAAAGAATGGHGRMLRVFGYLDDRGHGQIVGLDAGAAIPLGGPPSRHYRLELRSRGGRVTRGRVAARPVHVDGVGTLTMLRGELPDRRGARRVTLSAGGKPVAKAVRSRHAPRVKLLSPRGRRGGARHRRPPRLRGRGRSICVRWRAGDADHDRLTVRVGYSRNRGRTWRTVSIGPDRGRACAPRSAFPPSRHARLRVQVSDGFNQTTARSGLLRVVKPKHRRGRAGAPATPRAG